MGSSSSKTSKVCLINPPTTDPHGTHVYFPMALLTLGGVLKKCGVSAELWDFDLFFKKKGNETENNFRKLIQNGISGVRTKIFGISSICSNFPMAIWIAREIKAYKPDAVVMLGGPQPSSVPGQILERFDFVDFVVTGEGEITLEEMIKVDFDPDQLLHIPGVWGRSNGKVCPNSKRHLTKHMDEFPLPDYSLINIQEYASVQKRKFLPCIEVGRGCPFHCTFCSTSLMWEKDFRVKTPARIFEEMEYLHQEYGFTEFDFIHDNFTTSRKFVMDFCEYMEGHNQHDYKWTASSRTDCLDVKRLERMHANGLSSLFFGVESGSERMQGVIKKNLEFEHFEPIIRRGNELGVSSTTAFILGFPEETKEDLDQTVHRALHYRSLGTDRIFFSKIAALTGTEIYRKYLPELHELNATSSISSQNYGLPYIRELIRDYPDLFSSFYHVPHPLFSSDYIAKFIEFSHLLINGPAENARLLIENLSMGATDLFERWNEWALSRGIEYYNFVEYNSHRFKQDFQFFLDETIYGANSTRLQGILPYSYLQPRNAAQAST